MIKRSKKDNKTNGYKKYVIIVILLLLLVFICLFPGLYFKYKKNIFIENVKKSVYAYSDYLKDNDFNMSKIGVRDKKLKLDETTLIDGTLMYINEGDKINVYYVTDGEFCAYGDIDNLIVKEGKCETTEEDKVIMSTYIISLDNNIYMDKNSFKNINVTTKEDIEIKNPEKKDSNFNGWSIKVTANMLNDDNGFLTTNMKAVWDEEVVSIDKESNVEDIKDVFNEENINEIELIVDPNMGLWNNSSEVKTFRLKNNDEMLLSNPTKKGHVFLGWSSMSSISSDDVISTKLTALYEKDYHSVSINLDGGESSLKTSYSLIEGETLKLENPIKNGYIFYGWLLDGKEYHDNKIIMGSKDISLKALWVNSNYNVSFELNGGVVESELPNSLKPFEKYDLPVPEKNGYTFTGFSVSGKDSKVENNVLTMGVSNTYLIANWKLNKYSINYELDGGNADNKNYYDIETSSFTLNNPIKEHYIFTGWTGSNLSKLSDNVTIKNGGTGNLKFYANWKPVNYNIVYYLNGGTLKVDSIFNYNIESSVNLSLPIRKGYDFDGWYLDSNFISESVSSINKGEYGNKEFYVKWNLKEYNINYELNGGELSNENISSYTIESDTFVLNNPIKDYYEFIGWTSDTSNNLEKNVTINKGTIGDKKYYANYSPVKYNVSYKLDGGELLEENISTYTVESDTFVLNNPTKVGYIFDGWYESDNFDTEKIEMIVSGSNGNKVLYAKWIPIQYNIIYHLNEDEIQQDIAVYTYNITDEFELPTPKKEGYRFDGWYTNIEYTGEVFVDIKKGTVGNIELYPKWFKYQELVNVDVYDYIKNEAVLDSKPSKFVTGDNGIDFSKNSALNNGQGIYITSESINSENPIYYYRGNVENNNVLFANICWKIIRTTETKGIKIIYNGTAIDGKCNNQGTDTHVTKCAFNSAGKASSGGYKYGKSQTLGRVIITSSMILAKDVEYVDGEYHLKDTYVVDSNPENDWYQMVDEYRYSCLSTTSDICTSVTYFYFSRNNRGTFELYGISLTNNIQPKDIIGENTYNSSNANDSKMKSYVETWFKNNLLSYESYIEDTVYCNDRSISNMSGWTKDGSILTPLYFDSYYRNAVDYKPSLVCKNSSDRFTKNISNGNGLLNYPIGLLTIDEASLVGYTWWNGERTNNFLHTGQIIWTMSPAMVSAGSTYSFVAYSMTDSVNVSSKYGVRPVISLKNGATIKQGDGTVNNPFVIQ